MEKVVDRESTGEVNWPKIPQGSVTENVEPTRGYGID